MLKRPARIGDKVYRLSGTTIMKMVVTALHLSTPRINAEINRDWSRSATAAVKDAIETAQAEKRHLDSLQAKAAKTLLDPLPDHERAALDRARFKVGLRASDVAKRIRELENMVHGDHHVITVLEGGHR